MDSLTQALLGASTFALVKNKDIGKKSLLIGAVAGTLPDLDVLLSPFFNEVAFISVHRSVSHSLFLAIVLSFLLGYVFYKKYGKEQSLMSWCGAFFLAIFTHSILDWCTTYGTKLLSPFSGHLFSANNIHIIEPIYTLILLVGVGVHFLERKGQLRGQKIMRNTLLISTLYLSWTFVSKGVANSRFVSELEKQNIEYQGLMISPTPLNSVLWHGIVKVENGYYFGTYSLFDSREFIDFKFEESRNEAIEKIKENKFVQYYLDYTQGFPLVKYGDNGEVKVYAIKYGPVNYFGNPEFVYPLCVETEGDQVWIDYSGEQRGPVKNYKNLFRRIRGI